MFCIVYTVNDIVLAMKLVLFSLVYSTVYGEIVSENHRLDWPVTKSTGPNQILYTKDRLMLFSLW